MGTFPIGITPEAPWRHLANSRNAHFGAGRVGYPIHGACDLLVPANTDVLAVQNGRIIRGPYEFLHIHDTKSGCESTTYAIDVLHDDFIARYAEIARTLPNGLAAKSLVAEGQVIAHVGTQCGGTMLHFEMFNDTSRLEGLTDRSGSTKYLYVRQAKYERRSDLLDPTTYLDSWWWEYKAKHNRKMDLSMEVYEPPSPRTRKR